MKYQIKAHKNDAGDWVLDVLAAPFGSPSDRDSDGEYFTPNTKFHLDKFKPVAVHYHGFTRDRQASATPQYIGRVESSETKGDGVWLRVVLDKTIEAAREVWEAARKGIAAASSGSVAHLVRKAATGEIFEWPMAEISLWEWSRDNPQANKRAIAVPALKAVYEAAGRELPDELVRDRESREIATDADGHLHDASDDSDLNISSDSSSDKDSIMDEEQLTQEQIYRLVSESVAQAFTDKEDAEKKKADAAKAQADAIRAALDAQAEELKAKHEQELENAKAEVVKARRLPDGGSGAPYQTKFHNISPYVDNLEPEDLSVAIGIMDTMHQFGRGPKPSQDAYKALAVMLAESDDSTHRAAKSEMIKLGLPVKANELNQSDLSNFGDEWVGQAYSTTLWKKVRENSGIVSQIPTVVVPQNMESLTIPVESTAPTFYKVSQASDQAANPGRIDHTFTTSRVGTTNQTLTVNKIGAAVPYTGEMVEDSLIRWAPEIRTILTEEFTEVLESIVIDGDTATGATTNINDIGGTPGGTENFLMFDGFRKLALVTNTANSRDGGTLAVGDYIETVKLMGAAGTNAVNKSSVAFLSDLNTHWKALQLTEVTTRDSVATPTIENGMLTSIWGYRNFATPNMHRGSAVRLSNTAGKVDLDTTSNNTKGSLLAVRLDQWRLGYKRRVTFETERIAGADAYTIYMHARIGMISRDNEAAAISYNLTV